MHFLPTNHPISKSIKTRARRLDTLDTLPAYSLLSNILSGDPKPATSHGLQIYPPGFIDRIAVQGRFGDADTEAM